MLLSLQSSSTLHHTQAVTKVNQSERLLPFDGFLVRTIIIVRFSARESDANNQ